VLFWRMVDEADLWPVMPSQAYRKPLHFTTGPPPSRAGPMRTTSARAYEPGAADSLDERGVALPLIRRGPGVIQVAVHQAPRAIPVQGNGTGAR
jgi:hypothetical protein